MRAVKTIWLIATYLVFGLLGGLAASVFTSFSEFQTSIVYYPMPYQIPPMEGGISLRLAMVHDVIHDRFPRSGPAYYVERNRPRQVLYERDALKPDGLAIDDHAVGLSAIGQHEAAVKLLRKKIQYMTEREREPKEMYTAYANLGTILVRAGIQRALAGDPDGKEWLREGVAAIHKAMDANPQAHFGRELWEALAAEFYLAGMEDAKILKEFDFIGNHLDFDRDSDRYNRAMLGLNGWNKAWNVRDFLRSGGSDEMRASLRLAITHVGAAEEWTQNRKTSLTHAVPFDAPVLGIVGLWREEGANPYYAVTLANIMARVGQRNLAWTAYARAIHESDRYSPDPQICKWLVEFCKTKQQELDVDPDVSVLYERELKYGQDYQKAYQQYEADKIAQGFSPDEPDFYKEFESSRPPIATRPGKEDLLKVRGTPEEVVIGMFFLGVGLGIFIRGLFVKRNSTPNSAAPLENPSPGR